MSCLVVCLRHLCRHLCHRAPPLSALVMIISVRFFRLSNAFNSSLSMLFEFLGLTVDRSSFDQRFDGVMYLSTVEPKFCWWEV